MGLHAIPTEIKVGKYLWAFENRSCEVPSCQQLYQGDHHSCARIFFGMSALDNTSRYDRPTVYYCECDTCWYRTAQGGLRVHHYFSSDKKDIITCEECYVGNHPEIPQ